MKHHSLAASSAVLFLLSAPALSTAAEGAAAPAAAETGLQLSLGTIKEKLEASAVRALVKFGDRLTLEDRLSNVAQPVFFAVTRKVEFDVGDRGSFNGLNLRYGAKAFLVPIKEVTLPNGETARLSDSSGWMHVFPMTLGIDADRSFKNRDVLLEGGYVPFKGDAGLSCFKLGGNPAIGLSAQVGHRTRDPATVKPEEKSSLRRVKAEILADFKLGCFRNTKSDAGADGSLADALAKDLADVQVLFEGRAWRDFDLHQSFRHAVLTIRVPTSKGIFMDFRREVGAEAPTFAKGSQFGVFLTVQY